MASFYLIKSKNVELDTKISTKLLEECAKAYKNVAIYRAIACENALSKIQERLRHFDIKQDLDSTYSFTPKTALKQFGEDENLFFSKIIQDFESLKAQYDCVFVEGFHKLGIFEGFESNVKLAKNLNTPIIVISEDENKGLTQKYLSQNLGGRNFALIGENFDFKELQNLKTYDFTTTHRFKFELDRKAKQNKKTVVLPESDDERILKASDILLKNGAVRLILLGDENEVKQRAANLNLNLNEAEIINPKNSSLSAEFANSLYEARKSKGMTLEEAHNLVKDRTYFGTLLVHHKKADAMVSGSSTTTAETIRPALQLIKTKEGISSVSGMFFMGLEDQVLAFADCAVNPNPNAQQLAETAYISAQTAKSFGLDPRVAMLSYSSGDSGKGESVDLVNEALRIAKEKYPELQIDGPMQFDCAYDAKTGAKKMPNSKIAGRATVYIFPDLDAANICYKAVQRTAGALAVGPILQGLKKPVNDLSRGCLVDDIVDTVILSAIQAQ